MPDAPAETPPAAEASFHAGKAVLWAAAFIIAAIALAQAGRLPGNPAYADMVSNKSDFTLLSAASGRGDETNPYEVLWVINERAEVLLVYEYEQATGLNLREAAYLPQLFRQGVGR